MSKAGRGPVTLPNPHQGDISVPIQHSDPCEGYLQEMKDDPGAEELESVREMDIGCFALKVACILWTFAPE
jgi:hypothetical protein